MKDEYEDVAQVKKEVTFSLEHALSAQRGSRDMAVLFLEPWR